jgi:hypothetical protein
VNHPSYTGDSITTLSIGVGQKVLTTQDGKNWNPGMVLRLYAGPALEMSGIVVAYAGTSLTLNVTDIVGAGTFSSWQISVLPSLNGLNDDHILNALGYVPVANNGANVVNGSVWGIHIAGNANTVSSIRGDQVTTALGYVPARPDGSNVAVGSTWQVHITGYAGAVAWNNVQGRPSLLSQFSNDAGFITAAGRSFPRKGDGGPINFNWAGQGGQPQWLWGGNDGVNMYVYDPRNFNVNYASVASKADWADAVPWGGVQGRPTQVSQFGNDMGYAQASWTIANFFNTCDTVSTISYNIFHGSVYVTAASLQDMGGNVRLNINIEQGTNSGGGN